MSGVKDVPGVAAEDAVVAVAVVVVAVVGVHGSGRSEGRVEHVREGCRVPHLGGGVCLRQTLDQLTVACNVGFEVDGGNC